MSARARRLRSSSAVRCTGKRGGAGTRGGGGEQASGPRAARRTGDRQAGDGPESDRAQRSERADRRSAAADLEGVRSATVGVGGRPSCGKEGGRQVRVRVALHRPVERHSSRDRAWATKSRWGRWEVGRDVDKQADLGRSGARDCGAPEWQDESVPTDADDLESSTVGDAMPINGGATTIPLDDIGDGASSYADDPPDSPENEPPPSAPLSPPKAPIV